MKENLTEKITDYRSKHKCCMYCELLESAPLIPNTHSTWVCRCSLKEKSFPFKQGRFCKYYIVGA